MRLKLSKFIPLMALVAAIFLMAAAACGSNDGKETRDHGAATAAPASGSGASALPHDTPAPASGSDAPTLPHDTPAPPANEIVPGEIEAGARKLLADALDVDERDFRLDSAEGIGWSDTSLGCPQEGYGYAQVVTPGYKLVFDLAGTSYSVHTNADGSHMVICEDGGSDTPALPLDTPEPSASETVPDEIESAARKLLADELGADEGDFRLDSAEGMGWPDTSLGCPQEGYAYAQVITPGYKLVFDLSGTSHAVHTNADGSHMVICEDGQ